MATSMFSNVTSADRRKKVVTYGKSSRFSNNPPPIPSPNGDALSPNRPQRYTVASNGSLKKPGGTTKYVSSSGSARTKTGSPDMFDVPSEDDSTSRPIKPTKKLPTKHQKNNLNVSHSENSAPAPSRASTKAMPTSRQPGSAKTTISATQRVRKPSQPLKRVSSPPPSSDNPTVLETQLGKTSQLAQIAEQDIKNGELVQTQKNVANSTTRATTPALSASVVTKKSKATPISLPKKTMLKSDNLQVFDVPSSDEERSLVVEGKSRQTRIGRVKKPVGTIIPSVDSTRKESAESDDSNTSKKRKRKGSVSSTSTTRPMTERKRESSIPQRSRKYQKKEDSISPGDISHDQLVNGPAVKAQAPVPVMNKPRRTRVRTVPILANPTIAKGQSSPAMLNSMLASYQLSKPSPISEATEITSLEDETMYEIPNSSVTPMRVHKRTISGSVTPRQKALFSSLLGDSSSSNTSASRISALQLTDAKPRSLIGNLSRSKSALTYSTEGRRPRLIDTIKCAEIGPRDDDEDEDSESESEEGSEGGSANGQFLAQPRGSRSAAEISTDVMDVDVEAIADSQTSQATSSFGTRSKLTYAKSRSYLQEATFEDALLISMDLDDNLGIDLQKDNLTEDENDPMSQVQARHELKRRGQQTAFQWEAETSINDISDKTSNSVRRSTMMELCMKMADESFTSQLLDSSLAHRFFNNISSNGEVIFDFAAAVAVIFILKTDSTGTILDQLHDTGITDTLVKLASNDMDVRRISRDRKTNLSKIAQESVEKFRTLVQDSLIWISVKPEKVSPQLVALKALESLILGLRRAGSIASLIDQDDVSKLVDISSSPSERLKSGNGLPQDTLVLDLILAILETASTAKQRQPTWSARSLQRLAALLPVFFQSDTALSTAMAVKLCMNLTNNKPKACQPFSGADFVQPLMSSIVSNFELLDAGLTHEHRTEVLETLILSLGAMINLAELNDQARLNVDDGKQTIETLVKIFLEGSERAAQVCS